MNLFARFTFLFLGFILSCAFLDRPASGQSLSVDDAGQISVLAGSGVGGAWRLNDAESDDPLQKMQELIQNKAVSNGAAENASAKQLPPLSTSVFHPDSLILADGGNDEITINEGYKGIVQTRNIMADGKTRTFELSPGANYTVTALRADGKLLIETVSPRGNKMIETYEPLAGGRKLKITVRIETPEAKELITLHRTYDRTIINLFTDDGTEME